MKHTSIKSSKGVEFKIGDQVITKGSKIVRTIWMIEGTEGRCIAANNPADERGHSTIAWLNPNNIRHTN